MVTQSTIFSIIIFDYQVVIINIIINSYEHSEIALLWNDNSEQASPIFKGVADIRINIYLTREITWQHDTREPRRQHEWPPFAMTIKESSWVLPHPSAIFHASVSADTSWVAQTLSHCTPMKRGKVSSNSSTHEATKFVGPHKSHMRQYIINLVHRGQMIGPQSTQAGATTFEAPNIKTYHSQPSWPVFSTFS